MTESAVQIVSQILGDLCSTGKETLKKSRTIESAWKKADIQDKGCILSALEPLGLLTVKGGEQAAAYWEGGIEPEKLGYEKVFTLKVRKFFEALNKL